MSEESGSRGSDGVASEVSDTVEVRLPEGRGGSTVWRLGDKVHRTPGPWTPTVHRFLRHLEAVGFSGAPRVIGLDADGREILTFIEGEVLADPAWQPGEPGLWPEWAQSTEALTAAGVLLRHLHEAASSFTPTNPVWKQYDWPVPLPGEIVCHGDVGRHNIAYRDHLPVALIDWDSIRPNQPLLEFGTAAWNLVPLADDAYFLASGWPQPPDLPRRLQAFAEAYGVTQREKVMWALQQAKQRNLETMRYWPISPSDAASYARLISHELDWFATTADELGQSLC